METKKNPRPFGGIIIKKTTKMGTVQSFFILFFIAKLHLTLQLVYKERQHTMNCSLFGPKQEEDVPAFFYLNKVKRTVNSVRFFVFKNKKIFFFFSCFFFSCQFSVLAITLPFFSKKKEEEVTELFRNMSEHINVNVSEHIIRGCSLEETKALTFIEFNRNNFTGTILSGAKNLMLTSNFSYYFRKYSSKFLQTSKYAPTVLSFSSALDNAYRCSNLQCSFSTRVFYGLSASTYFLRGCLSSYNILTGTNFYSLNFLNYLVFGGNVLNLHAYERYVDLRRIARLDLQPPFTWGQNLFRYIPFGISLLERNQKVSIFDLPQVLPYPYITPVNKQALFIKMCLDLSKSDSNFCQGYVANFLEQP